jgi:hypothetical protein
MKSKIRKKNTTGQNLLTFLLFYWREDLTEVPAHNQQLSLPHQAELSYIEKIGFAFASQTPS